MNMMEKVEKLIDSIQTLVDFATIVLEKQAQPVLKAEMGEDTAADTAPAPAAAAEEAPKKTRKPRTPKVEEEAPPAPIEEKVEDKQDPRTDEELFEEVKNITREYVALAKNDTPKDGMARAKDELKKLNREKLQDLSREEKIAWIGMVGAWIKGRK